MKKGRIVRLTAVLLLCCFALTAAGMRETVQVPAAVGGAKIKTVVMTPYPGSRQKMGEQEPLKPGQQGGAIPLPNYGGETLTLGLLADQAAPKGK